MFSKHTVAIAPIALLVLKCLGCFLLQPRAPLKFLQRGNSFLPLKSSAGCFEAHFSLQVRSAVIKKPRLIPNLLGPVSWWSPPPRRVLSITVLTGAGRCDSGP